MPVRFNKDGEEEYSYRTGDYGSRDFARLRRFGGEDPEDARTMSLVSSPLQVPLIGQRRNASPSFRASPGPQQLAVDEDDFEEEIASLQRADPPRRSYGSYNATKYDRNDDFKLEPLVPTYQPRVGRSSQRYRERSYEPPTRYTPKRRSQPQYLEQDDEEEYDEPQIPRHQMRQFREFLRQQEEQKAQEEEEARLTPARRQKPQHDDIDLSFRWRKRGTQEQAATNDVGYVVPPLRKRVDPGLQDDDEQSKSVAAYLAKRKQFAVEDDDEMLYYKNPNYQYRMLGGGDRPMISNRDVEESIQRSKLEKAPMFDMKLRSHVVWEKMNVKFTCTVRGHPMPRVTWYKDMVPLEPSLHNPGKYKISNNFGLHSLEICRASIEDSGTYRVSLQNRKGEISSYATLVVRRYDGGKMGVVDMKSGYNLKKPTDYPDVEGMDIPERRPRAGDIKVEEYDELPQTDASRHFKSQLENLDFDVNKLIKEAKLEKDIAGSDAALASIEDKRQEESTTKTVSTHEEENSTHKSLSQTDHSNETQKSDEPKRTSLFEAMCAASKVMATSGGDFNEEQQHDSSVTKTDTADDSERFNVAIEVTVTNESKEIGEEARAMELIDNTFDIEQKA